MEVDKFKPGFLSDADSKAIATRQLLSFLSVNEEESHKRARSKALFSLSKIPPDAIGEESPFFKWQSRLIYDVDGVRLFWDQSIKLDDTNSLTVRTAASDLLRTPVWSVRAGKTRDFDALISGARSALDNYPDLKPVLIDKKIELICYAYPKLGILASSVAQPGVRFVLDLWERNPIPVENEQDEKREPRKESVNTIWSPYDFVTRGRVDHFRVSWHRNFSLLRPMPAKKGELPSAIAAARAGVQELTTCPELCPVIGQEKSSYCAPATMKMILRHHEVIKSQLEIAKAMGTHKILGTEPEDQAEAVDNLTADKFVGSLDESTSFNEGMDEIHANRPFKTGGIAHARAVGGFMIDSGGMQWLDIFDPMPLEEGDVYSQCWQGEYHDDFVYVRPSPPPPPT